MYLTGSVSEAVLVLLLVGVLPLLILIGIGVWLALRMAEWREQGQAAAFWADRRRDHQLRQQELAGYEAAGELPVRITREYPTADEFTWESDELEARGYELAHQPFTNAEGLIIVTYRLPQTAEPEPAWS